MDLASPVHLRIAADHLSQCDPVLAPIIASAGLAEFSPHSDYYGALVNSIVGQQLSVKAAASIKQRFRDLFGGVMPTPQQILGKSIEELRAVGFSNAKANYVRDLAQHIVDGRVCFGKLKQQSNQEIITELTDVKGIGEWTVQMFLMFCMGRLDVLPTGDRGIRNGIRALYDLIDTPTPNQMREIADKHHWHPYQSVASWYIWRSLDNELPRYTMAEIHAMFQKETGKDMSQETDLTPEEEKWICEYAKKKDGCEAVYATGLPASKMKFYHMKGEGDTARSADLLFRGIEISTVPQREHRYEQLVAQMKAADVDPDGLGFAAYVSAFKHGLPAHGGFGFGVDRLTEKAIGLGNVKEAILFPRDINRLAP